ncbi:MAG TPA: acetolactate synthase large subunit [Alphaproteobacteria bacterium]|nr:acetolactate synthase large subunit [Alphaproteobacteria bacterium]
MNGADCLAQTLIAGGVKTCFTNPGTSEMHFVSALDRTNEMRCVLCLFEGVATGAADGFARMTGTPAATLLHLGPGLANGLANLHNASRAQSPIVNIVGDHAIVHRKHDAPLASDIESAARTVSCWVRTSQSAAAIAKDTADAIVAARTPPGGVATLMLPADVAWSDGTGPIKVPAPPARAAVSQEAIREAATLLRKGEAPLLVLYGPALRARGLAAAGRIAKATGAGLIGEMSNARLERGAGRVDIDRVPYVVEQALEKLKPYRTIILCGAKAPVAFFAYPDKPGELWPPAAKIHTLATRDQDIVQALEALADELGAKEAAPVAAPSRPSPPTGAITFESIGAAIGALLPENAIVVDESITSGRGLFAFTRGAPPHDWLQNRGGSIGYGPPVAVGAAVACPDRKVIALEGDGSAMYTVQALWTQAREGLDVVTVVFANRSYRILLGEMSNMRLGNPGPKALDMLELRRPELDWVKLAGGMGVPASRVTTIDEFVRDFGRALRADGPYLIEMVF